MASGDGVTGAGPYAVKRNLNKEPLFRGRGPVLGQLDVELTERCDNACLHCFINRPAEDEEARARELDTAQWEDVLRQAADLGALTVRFTGGEPLLREDFADLYLFARRLGMQVLLFTNARRMTAGLADLLARVPPRRKIEVTVYGMHRASYEAASRAPGSYAEFRRGVDLLLDRRIPFVVKGALLPPNKEEVGELESWAATLPWMDRPPGYSMFFDLRGRRDSAAKNRVIAGLRLSGEEALAALKRRGEAYYKEMAEFCGKFLSAPGDKLFSCGAGLGGCVDAYGMLQPCLGLRDPALGYDLRKGSLREALTEVFARLREMRARSAAYLERCARCFLRGLCEQCPGKSWAEHGTLDTPVAYFCEMAHYRARDLGLLSEGEQAWEVVDGAERVKSLSKGAVA